MSITEHIKNHKALPHTKKDVGLSNVENLKVNLIATTAPAVTDDSGEGYEVGSRWIDTTNNKEYVCLDSTVGAAIWTETTGAGGGGSLTVEDIDGSPSVINVNTLKFTNGTLTDEGSGVVRIDIPGDIDGGNFSDTYINVPSTDGGTF